MDNKANIPVAAWSGFAGEKLVRDMLSFLCERQPAAPVTPVMVERTPEGAFQLGKKQEDGAYLPPEGDKGASSVVWSIGAVAYFLLMGVPVFGGMAGTLQTPSTPVPTIPPRKCSRELASLLSRMLAYKPQDRPDLAAVAAEAASVTEAPRRLLKGEFHPDLADDSFWKEEMV